MRVLGSFLVLLAIATSSLQTTCAVTQPDELTAVAQDVQAWLQTILGPASARSSAAPSYGYGGYGLAKEAACVAMDPDQSCGSTSILRYAGCIWQFCTHAAAWFEIRHLIIEI